MEGLDAGANDYLSKPFHLAELEARIRSLTRRQFIQRDICLKCGRLVYDTRTRIASVDGAPVALTRKETGVLEYLMLHEGRPVLVDKLTPVELEFLDWSDMGTGPVVRFVFKKEEFV